MNKKFYLFNLLFFALGSSANAIDPTICPSAHVLYNSIAYSQAQTHPEFDFQKNQSGMMTIILGSDSNWPWTYSAVFHNESRETPTFWQIVSENHTHHCPVDGPKVNSTSPCKYEFWATPQCGSRHNSRVTITIKSAASAVR